MREKFLSMYDDNIFCSFTCHRIHILAHYHIVHDSIHDRNNSADSDPNGLLSPFYFFSSNLHVFSNINSIFFLELHILLSFLNSDCIFLYHSVPTHIWLCYSPSITHSLQCLLLLSNVGDIEIDRDQQVHGKMIHQGAWFQCQLDWSLNRCVQIKRNFQQWLL